MEKNQPLPGKGLAKVCNQPACRLEARPRCADPEYSLDAFTSSATHITSKSMQYTADSMLRPIISYKATLPSVQGHCCTFNHRCLGVPKIPALMDLIHAVSRAQLIM